MANTSCEEPSRTPVISMRGITKTFPGVVANDHIHFDVYLSDSSLDKPETGSVTAHIWD